jgi:hypothetical protein
MLRRAFLGVLASGLGLRLAVAAEPMFRSRRFDVAAAHRLVAFCEANIDRLCAFDLVVATNAFGGHARIEEATLIVRAGRGALEFWFPVDAVQREGDNFRIKALLTPLRGEPEAGLERYQFNMLG